MYELLIGMMDKLIYVPEAGMVHPGLPSAWVLFVVSVMVMIGIYNIWRSTAQIKANIGFQFPLAVQYVKPFITQPWVLFGLRLFAASVFLLVIYTGLFGTPIPERNLATVLTWTIWWSGVIISIFFVGSAWCAILMKQAV